jgi:hypothetical protein
MRGIQRRLIIMVNPDANIHGTIGMNRSYGMHSGKVTCRDIEVNNDFEVKGTLTFGDASVDNFIVKGRMATGAAAGSALDIAATYAYGEGVELRYQVTDWTGVGSSFKGMYLRSECATTAATAKSVYGTEIYGVCNNVTMTTGSLWGTLTYAYVKGVGAVTVNNMYAGQFELTWDASRTADCTISTEAAVLLAKVTGGRVADYTKVHGIILRFGEMDGDSQLFGDAISIQDDAAMSGTSTFTKGIEIAAGCTTGISIEGAATDGMAISGACADAIHISGTNTETGLHISGDQVIGILYDVDAAATDGFKMLVDDGLTCTTGINLARTGTTGICTTGIKVDTDGTTAIDVGTGFTGTTMLLLEGTGTDGISITGACADALHISGTNTTTALHISGDQAIFALFDVDASADNGLEMNVDTSMTLSTGIEMSGAGTLTTGILINPTACTTAINVDTGVVDVATRVICSGMAAGYETPSLSVGTYGAGTAIVDTVLLDNIFFSVNVRTATNKTSADTSCMAAYIGNGNTAATTNTKMQCLLSSMQLGGNVYDAYSIQAHLAVNASLATQNANAHITGSSAKVTLGSGFTVSKGWVTAGLFIVDGAGLVSGAGSMCHGVAIVAEAGMTASTCDALLYLNADSVVVSAIETIGGGANIPYLLSMTSMGNSGYVTTGGTDCSASGGTDPSFTIKVIVPGGADGFIRVWGAA